MASYDLGGMYSGIWLDIAGRGTHWGLHSVEFEGVGASIF